MRQTFSVYIDLMGHFCKQHKALLVLLAVSWAVRVILVLQGGQHYWQDEHRYMRTWSVLLRLSQANFAGILDYVLQTPDHTGFILVGGLPAVIQYITLWLLGLPVEESIVENTMWVAAIPLSLASVANIGLTYAVARRAGADKREGLIAAFMMACASTMFYYARHLLPYDSAMGLALAALWIALDARPSFKMSITCGVVTGLAYLTYNGYWPTALIVLIIHALYGQQSGSGVIKRGLGVGLGFVALPGLLTLVSLARPIKPYGMAVAEFGRKTGIGMPQAGLAEGWSLPWAYLWHAEHGLLLVWVLGAGTVFWLSGKRWRPAYTRGLCWLGAAVGIYLLMVLGSTGLSMFPFLGRHARQMVPFLCLMTACVVTYCAADWWLKNRRWLVVILVFVLQAVLNFRQPLTLQFPNAIVHRVIATYGHVTQDATVAGRETTSGDAAVAGDSDRDVSSRYVLLNALNTRYLFPVQGVKAPPYGKVLFSVPNPMQFLPYQYEGFSPMQRWLLRSTDLSIRLIDTQVAP